MHIGEVYRCNICGNIIELLHPGAESLVCCGLPMEKLVEKTTDDGNEKHVPVIEKTDNGFKVTVGSIAHPMEEEHYIEWIELITASATYITFLAPGEKPAPCPPYAPTRARSYRPGERPVR